MNYIQALEFVSAKNCREAIAVRLQAWSGALNDDDEATVMCKIKVLCDDKPDECSKDCPLGKG